MATRRTIGKLTLVNYTSHYEYGTKRFVMPGVSLSWRTRRRVFSQTWEVRIINDGILGVTPMADIVDSTGHDDWLPEEVVEVKSYESPFVIIHRETWTRREKWETLED